MAIESELLCGSCFLEGPHVGHRSQLYLPLKLTHHARIDFGAFLTELDSFQTTFLDKPFDQMKTAIKTLFAPMKRFELESVHLSTVLDYNSLLESCGQKQDAVRLLLLDFSTKMAEYITQIKDVSESWNKSARSLDSERVPERREDREEEESRLDEEQENGEREHEDGEGEGERENEMDEREEEEKEGQSEEELDSQPEEEDDLRAPSTISVSSYSESEVYAGGARRECPSRLDESFSSISSGVSMVSTQSASVFSCVEELRKVYNSYMDIPSRYAIFRSFETKYPHLAQDISDTYFNMYGFRYHLSSPSSNRYV